MAKKLEIERMSENSGGPESSKERGISITGDGPTGGHLPAMTDKIYDLLDVDELPGKIYELTDIVEEPNPLPEEGFHKVMVIDGRGYKKAAQPEKVNHALAEIIAEEKLSEQPQLLPEDEMIKKMAETVERIAREMIPDIAERVIREEIEKLKKESEEEVH